MEVRDGIAAGPRRRGQRGYRVGSLTLTLSGVKAAGDNTDGTVDGTADDGKGSTGREKGGPGPAKDSICLTLPSGLPKLDENVTRVGFPQGGTQSCVTRRRRAPFRSRGDGSSWCTSIWRQGGRGVSFRPMTF